jgi:hypothetical protein
LAVSGHLSAKTEGAPASSYDSGGDHIGISPIPDYEGINPAEVQVVVLTLAGPAQVQYQNILDPGCSPDLHAVQLAGWGLHDDVIGCVLPEREGRGVAFPLKEAKDL